MRTICDLSPFAQEQSPILGKSTSIAGNSYLSQGSSFGLAQVNDFRYNSRYVPRFALRLEGTGFSSMPTG